MATFYVLPSRHQFGQRFAEILGSLFPDVRYTPWDWTELAESIGSMVEMQMEIFLVYREDLDERLSVKDALLQGFGAELDDEIVEIQFGPGLTQFLHQPWATEMRTSRAA